MNLERLPLILAWYALEWFVRVALAIGEAVLVRR